MPVVAHCLLNSMAIVAGALDTVLQHGDALDEASKKLLLEKALERTEAAMYSLRELVGGLPAGAIVRS